MDSEQVSDRRAPAGDRRRYNRRAGPAVTPPYFEAFERIAIAMERIAGRLEHWQGGTDVAPQPMVRPRRSTDHS